MFQKQGNYLLSLRSEAYDDGDSMSHFEPPGVSSSQVLLDGVLMSAKRQERFIKC